MAFEALKASQQAAIQILLNSYKNKRLSHAYIFEGEAGTKKFETALFFASLLLCDDDNDKPCGECNHCRRIQNQTHPNVYIIRPSKRMVVKEDIQGLQREFNKTALEDGDKIYIISEADTMNAYAANALLKFLEEPHDNIYGILLVKDSHKLLPTIRSRSQTITFHSLPENQIYENLVDQGYEPKMARLSAAIHRTTDSAEAFLSLPNIYDLIDIITTLYDDLANQKSLVISFQRESFDVIKTTDDYQALLDIMMHYQKDLIYGKMNHHQKIIFEDQKANIDEIITHKSKAMLLEELQMMLDIKHHLNYYINERLAIDNLLLALERRINHG